MLCIKCNQEIYVYRVENARIETHDYTEIGYCRNTEPNRYWQETIIASLAIFLSYFHKDKWGYLIIGDWIFDNTIIRFFKILHWILFE